MRLSVLAAAVSLSIGLSMAADVHAAIKKRTFIPAQGLGPALRTFAKDHKLQIIYVSEEVAKLHTRGVVGDVTSDEALRSLLQGTDLEYRYLDERTVTVFSAAETEPIERCWSPPSLCTSLRPGMFHRPWICRCRWKK